MANNRKIDQTPDECQGSSPSEISIAPQPRRPRSPTLLKLQWLAERVRKCEIIKKELESGSYKVDPDQVAKALLNIT